MGSRGVRERVGGGGEWLKVENGRGSRGRGGGPVVGIGVPADWGEGRWRSRGRAPWLARGPPKCFIKICYNWIFKTACKSLI